jgi:hypothetical protein
MSKQTKSQDQRKTFRCTVAESRQCCELKVGDETLPARLLDESLGGFAVLVDRLAGLEVDRTAELSTDAGWFLVRVVHVAEADPPEGEEVAAEEPATWFRLGLLRLGDAALPEEPAVSRLAAGLQFQMRQWYSSRTTLMAVSMLLMAAVVVVPLALAVLVWRSEQWKGKHSDSSSNSIWPRGVPTVVLSPPATQPASGGSPFAPVAAEARGGGSEVAPASPAFNSGGGSVQNSASSFVPRPELQELMRRLPGASALMLPDVIKKLRLTDNQQKRIRQLIDAATNAIRQLDKELPGEQRQEMSQLREHVFGEALQESLKLLTNQQRAEWEKLSGDPPPPPKGN